MSAVPHVGQRVECLHAPWPEGKEEKTKDKAPLDTSDDHHKHTSRRLVLALPRLGCGGAEQRSHDGGGHVVERGQSSGVERDRAGHAHHEVADADPEGHGEARY